MSCFLVQGKLAGLAPPEMGVHVCVSLSSQAPAGVLVIKLMFMAYVG